MLVQHYCSRLEHHLLLSRGPDTSVQPHCNTVFLSLWPICCIYQDDMLTFNLILLSLEVDFQALLHRTWLILTSIPDRSYTSSLLYNLMVFYHYLPLICLHTFLYHELHDLKVMTETLRQHQSLKLLCLSETRLSLQSWAYPVSLDSGKVIHKMHSAFIILAG